jgi:hypothetical protein
LRSPEALAAGGEKQIFAAIVSPCFRVVRNMLNPSEEEKYEKE